MKLARWFRALGLAAITSMAALSLAAQSDDLATIQQKLNARITLAKVDTSGEIVAAGSVITLLKGQLQMCSVSSPPAAGAPANTYKNGKLSAGMFSWRLGLGLVNIDPNTIPMRTYAAGEKFWIVGYNVKKNGMEFKLWTDADSNNIRYWAWLEIPFDKKQMPSPDQAMNTLAEVLGVQAAEPAPDASAQTAAAPVPPPTPAPAPAPAPLPDIAPPPPPADAPPPTISLGQTMEQVRAGFGEPLKVGKLGTKTIFYYKDMKVTFTGGKVSNVE